MFEDTICAPASPVGSAAIAVVRVSGPTAMDAVDKLVVFRRGTAAESKGFEVKFGVVPKVDDVLVSVYRAPHSYTGEDAAEIGCHASPYIVSVILQRLIRAGCRMAEPGEFTKRAFLNGKMDLAQAEAVADLIAADSQASHRLAFSQMKGGYSEEFRELRAQLVELASLVELELDFSEEEVEFADREKFMRLLSELKGEVQRLVASFHSGNALKNGIPVAIVGKTNVGKSTLLNALLDDDRAIVSDIPGTTRDTVEDTLTVGGTQFRVIDTAGIRQSDDTIEQSGIERSFRAMEKADVILYLVDATENPSEVATELGRLFEEFTLTGKKIFLIINKIDRFSIDKNQFIDGIKDVEILAVSAKNRQNVSDIMAALSRYAEACAAGDHTLLTNARHYDLMRGIATDITRIEEGFATGLPTDLVAIDVRSALDKLGQLTGTITDNDILNTVFGRFCIGT